MTVGNIINGDMKMLKRLLFIVGLLWIVIDYTQTAQAQTAVSPTVQAILFYSPTCPHCHDVINNLLVPMQEQYGDQLQILGVDTTTSGGSNLFVVTLEHFGLPVDQMGVPTLVVADTVLNGSIQIPEEFPGIVESGLAAGGIGWPEIPGLQELVPDLPPSAAPQAAASLETVEDPAVVDEIGEVEVVEETAVSGIQTGVTDDMTNSEHPVNGAWLAWLVMALLVTSLLYAGYQSVTTRSPILNPPTAGQNAFFALLVLVGLVVAGYLAYIETTQSLAVCGPVGDCNTVQISDYAKIMDIPVAVLGLINYLIVGLLWFAQSWVPEDRRQLIWLGLLGLAFIGTIFSIYLTTLELFVIRAVCAWCLTSAAVTALLLIGVCRLVEGQQPALART
jgi:uncharacterized membrane protein/thiol-disulfide isomerase/thioredoxin